MLYQIPAEETGLPMVFLHGYGQSRMGWMTTPDGREGWSDMFLKMGHSVFLIDQPRRGEAGQTSVAGTINTEPSDQTWYTQFRIGTYLNDEFTYNEGSQFPAGEEALDQFFRQMTPDTGMDNAGGDQNIDNTVVAQAVAATIDEVYARTGKDSILVTHSQGGMPLWERYLMTIEEASSYFRIGENKLRQLANEYKEECVVMNGNRMLIKKKKFEKVIDRLEQI